jgi:hypothetical protein
MSIILKKRKGLLTPKTQVPIPSSILGNLGLGIGTIIGKKKEDLIDDLIEEAIERLILEKTLLYSSRLIRSIDYFATYYRESGEKRIKSIFIKKRVWKTFLKLENEEMMSSGAKPEEFLLYLKKKRCKKVKINRKELENII